MFGKNLIKEFELEKTFSIEEFMEELKRIEEAENKEVYDALIERSKSILDKKENGKDVIGFIKAKDLTKRVCKLEKSYIITRAIELADSIAKQLNLSEIGKMIIAIKLIFRNGVESLISFLLSHNIGLINIEQINNIINSIKTNPYQISRQIETTRKNIIYICDRMHTYNGCFEPSMVINILNYLVASNKDLYIEMENGKQKKI